MAHKLKQSNFKKIIFSQNFLTFIGLAVIILISFPFCKNFIKQYKINKEIADFKKEISELQNKNSDLKNFVAYLESDQFAEEQARLSLGLKKPGEELTIIKTADKILASSSPSVGNPIFNIPGYKKEEVRQEINNPKKWLKYFFKD